MEFLGPTEDLAVQLEMHKKSFRGNVQITAKSRSDVKIDDISAIPNEDKVLFPPNAKFTITKKERDNEGNWNIDIEES
ncbi:MAG: ADP-ribosyltransferase domain-containing protein [Cellvibrionaceae bacterium]